MDQFRVEGGTQSDRLREARVLARAHQPVQAFVAVIVGLDAQPVDRGSKPVKERRLFSEGKLVFQQAHSHFHGL